MQQKTGKRRRERKGAKSYGNDVPLPRAGCAVRIRRGQAGVNDDGLHSQAKQLIIPHRDRRHFWRL